MRTLGSINHPGPDEEPIAILLRTAVLYAAMGYDPTTGGPARRAIRAGPFLTERIHYTGPRSYKDGLSVAKPIMVPQV